jgi:hypothetical protein
MGFLAFMAVFMLCAVGAPLTLWTILFLWPAVIRIAPKTPAAVWAHTMLHPATRDDWRRSGPNYANAHAYHNSRLNAEFTVTEFGLVDVDFPTSWADRRKLGYSAMRLDRRLRCQEKMAAFERTASAYESAYGSKSAK